MYPPSCGGIVLDISIVAVSSAKALPLKSTPHSSFSAPPHLTTCQHCWLWLCIILYVNIQIQKTRQGNLLVLLSQYVNIIFSGSPTRLPSSANVHCQAGTCSLLAHRPVSTLSTNVQVRVLCVHIIALCHGGHTVGYLEHICLCPLCVHTANSTCVSLSPVCDCDCKYHRYSSNICVSTRVSQKTLLSRSVCAA